MCDVVMWDARIYFFQQKAAYEMRISDWSSDLCSSDLPLARPHRADAMDDDRARQPPARQRLGRQRFKRGFGRARIMFEVEHRHAVVGAENAGEGDRKSTRLNSSTYCASSMPSSA